MLKPRHYMVAVCGVLLSGCATFSAGNLFSTYSEQKSEAYQALRAGDYQQAFAAEQGDVAGPILDNMERGRVAFLAQQYPQSFAALSLSDDAVREWQDQALISASETATSLGSLVVNDNLNNYQPADYELGFLHLYLGLNYLKRNDFSGALVEMRRANQVQEAAKQKRARALADAQSELERSGVQANLGSVLARYPNAGKTLEAVQNGYLFFLSGLLYEADNDLNAAYVDYRRALAVSPNNPQVVKRTATVARKLGMRDDLTQLEQQYGKALTSHNEPGAKMAQIIVIEERDVVEAMRSWRLDIPIYSHDQSTILPLTLPYYHQGADRAYQAITLNGETLSAALLSDVDQMAQYSLQERLPKVIARQVLRLIAKDQIRRESTNGDDLGNALFTVWNTLTEQADTRSWQSLPARVYVSTHSIPVGDNTLRFPNQQYQFSARAGETVFVWVSRQGTQQSVWHKSLGRL